MGEVISLAEYREDAARTASAPPQARRRRQPARSAGQGACVDDVAHGRARTPRDRGRGERGPSAAGGAARRAAGRHPAAPGLELTPFRGRPDLGRRLARSGRAASPCVDPWHRHLPRGRRHRLDARVGARPRWRQRRDGFLRPDTIGALDLGRAAHTAGLAHLGARRAARELRRPREHRARRRRLNDSDGRYRVDDGLARCGWQRRRRTAAADDDPDGGHRRSTRPSPPSSPSPNGSWCRTYGPARASCRNRRRTCVGSGRARRCCSKAASRSRDRHVARCPHG